MQAPAFHKTAAKVLLIAVAHRHDNPSMRTGVGCSHDLSEAKPELMLCGE